MVLMNDFTAEPAEMHDAMLAGARRVIDSGWSILGKEVEAFEREWAGACGTAHAVGVANGLDAIEIILRALDIGAGDEVITTPMTAFATVLAVLRAGATPVLADIAQDTALLDPESVARCIGSRTRAVLPVHLYGQVGDMDAWRKLCADHSLLLIEDCAQAHLSSWRGKVAGSAGVAGAYSFYPTKNLGTFGDAGMIVTDDAQLAARAMKLRNYGQSERYIHTEIGLNSRLDEIHAAMLRERYRWLERSTLRRRQIANTYRNGISNPLIDLLAPPSEDGTHVYHLFVVRCEARDSLQAHLAKRGVQTLIHYPVPIHRQVPCMNVQRDPQGLSQAERHAATCLSLPCHPQMTDAGIAQVIDAVNSFRV
jgi:dTDP-4-amino-4,6-dideoxygalactose transaminase